MPDPTFDPLSRTIATLHSRDPRADAARREALLEASVIGWLCAAGHDRASARTSAQELSASLRAWLHETAPERRVERLPALAEALARQLAPQPAPPVEAFLSAFAHALLESTVAEIEREAARAGHAEWFGVLRPFLHREPTTAQRAELATHFDAAGNTLALALSRLRHRLHQRIDVALALWAPDREARDLLRRRLRDSLLATERTP